MANGTVIIVFILSLSFVMSMMGMAGSPFDQITQTVNQSFVPAMSSVGNSSGGTIQSGTNFFPNPYTLFAGIFSSLLAFVTYPITVWWALLPNDQTLALFLSTLFVLLYGIAAVSWLKGGGEF